MAGSFVDSFLKGIDAGNTLVGIREKIKDRKDKRADIDRERDIQKASAEAQLGIPDFVEQTANTLGGVGANLPPGVQPITPITNTGGGPGAAQSSISAGGARIPTSKNYEDYADAAKRKIVEVGGGPKELEAFDTAFRERRRRGANQNILQAGNLVKAADAARAAGDIASADEFLRQAKPLVEKGYSFMNNGTHLKVNVVNGQMVGTFWDESTGKPKKGQAVIPVNMVVLEKAASIFNDPEMFQAAELDHIETLRKEKIAKQKDDDKLESDEKRTGITADASVKSSTITAGVAKGGHADRLTAARELVTSNEKISKEKLKVEEQKIENDFAKHAATIETTLKAKQKTEMVSVINTVIKDAQSEVLTSDNPLFAEIALSPGTARFAMLEQTIELMEVNDNLSVIQAVEEAKSIFIAAIKKGLAEADAQDSKVVPDKIKAGIPPPPSSVPGGSAILSR